MGQKLGDPVRAATAAAAQQKIDDRIRAEILHFASQPREKISARIRELEAEWDMERVLEANASSIALTALVLGMTRNRAWLGVTGGVLGFLLYHSVNGWCPPVPLLRKLGVRTRNEIDRELFALKILRGDFQMISTDPTELKQSPAHTLAQAVTS